MKAVYLKPRSSYRTELRSDTLFGLLCWGVRQVFSEERLEKLLKSFTPEHSPFLVSSAFPYREIGEGKKQHFLPRPLLKPMYTKIDSSSEAQRQKEFKKKLWIDAEAFQRFISGMLDEEDYYKSDEWKQKKAPSFRREDVLHNTIDRLSGTTGGEGGNLFQLPETFIEGGGGLYFLARGEETEALEGALGFLSHMGMGGDSALGKGQFSISIKDVELFQEPGESTHFLTLSLYHPRPEEAVVYQKEEAWYDLVMRKGKVGGHFLHVSDFWKRTVPMFTEGSVFLQVEGIRFYGDNPPVKGITDGLPFEVRQYGSAFDVKMKIKGG